MKFTLELSEDERQTVMHVLDVFREGLDRNLSYYDEHGELPCEGDPRDMESFLATLKTLLRRMGDERSPPEGLGPTQGTEPQSAS